jgi:sugar O-acyltransferase (sialic acid O-acetyltransferase NeuD family)
MDVVLGAGGHARETVEVLLRSGTAPSSLTLFVEPEAFDEAAATHLRAQGLTVVTSLEGLAGRGYVAAVGDPSLRRRLVALATSADLVAERVVSSHAVVASSATLAEGVVVFPHAVISSDVAVGQHVQVNQGARLSHDVMVGAHATLGPGALLTGAVIIGDDAVVGAGAVVLPGRTVGTAAVVGAGSVVVNDVAAGTTVAGNPARVLPQR